MRVITRLLTTGNRSIRLLAAALVLTAGSVAPLWAQLASPVYMDDSPAATEGLARAQELAGVGNLTEAANVLQRVLDDFGDAVVSAGIAGDDDLFISVRARVNSLLLGNPALLERYRESQGDAARRALAAGRGDEVEAHRLLTAPGFDATLIIAEQQLENARFEAAMLTLEQLEKHPDRTGERGARAAELLTRVARYTTGSRADTAWEWATRWRGDAKLGAADRTSVTPPPRPLTRDPFDSGEALHLQGLLERPLASDRIGEPIDALRAMVAGSMPREVPESAMVLHAAPTVSGDLVYVNDGERVSAWDRFTLTLRWRQHVDAPPSISTSFAASSLEEMNRVTVQEPWAVAVTGLSLLGRQTPERTVTAFDARSGDALWSKTIMQISPQFDESMLRGTAIIDEGTAIVTAVKQSQQKRLVGMYLIGMDIPTGATRWVRTIASIGSLPWSNGRLGAGDESVAEQGIVYRGDRLGVIAAVESQTGRVRWVRRVTPEPMTQSAFIASQWQTNQPIIRGTQLFTMSPDRREVLVLDARTGALERRMTAQRLALPSYLLICRDWLVGVSGNKIRALDLSDPQWFDKPSIPVAEVPDRGIRGRVVVQDDSLMIPVVEGVRLVSMPEAAQLAARLASESGPDGTTFKLESPGTVVAMESQLLVVDDERIHSYLLWDVAEKLLGERMKSNTEDPEPAITYAELSHQSGRTERVLPAVDAALSTIERDPLGQKHAGSRSRLFRALLEMVEPDARTALAARLTAQDRRELIDRLARAAADPGEQVAYRMAAGRALEAEDQARAAVEMYQSVLDSQLLSSQSYTSRQTTLPADVEATRRLRDIVRASGQGVYESFEQEATRRLGEAGDAAAPEALEAIARRYPLSTAAARAWSQAAERYAADQRLDSAVFALEEGYRAATETLPENDPLLGSIAGRLILAQERAGRIVPAIRLVENLGQTRPNLTLSDGTASLDRAALLVRLRERLASVERRPDIGTAFGKATMLENWTITEPACGNLPGAPTNVAMFTSGQGETAMFRFDKASGTAEQAWAGVTNELFLFMDERAAYFGRGVGDMGSPDQVVVRRDLDSGKVRWATPPFRSIFQDGANAPDPMRGLSFETPLKSGVSISELFTMLDADVFMLVERSGRIAAFDAVSGDLLWSKPSTISRVYDAAMGSGRLVLIGADEVPSEHSALETEMRHTAMVLEARTGQLLMRHEEPRPMRWARVSDAGEAVIGCEPGVICIDAFRRLVRWRSESSPLENSVEAWLTPSRMVVRDRDDELWRIDLETGERDPQALDTGARLDQGFMRIVAATMDDRFAVASQRGFAVFDAAGELVAADARTGEVLATEPAFAQKYVAIIEPLPTDNAGGELSRYSIGLADIRTGKAVTTGEILLAGPPTTFTAVDGALLITAANSTYVVPAPANP